MGRRKGNLRHGLRRWLVCSSKNGSPNRFLHEKDSLACSPSFEEHFRGNSSTRAATGYRTAFMEPSPSSAATATANTARPIVRDLPRTTTTHRVTSTKSKDGTTKATSPARSVHSAVTEVWSNSAARRTLAVPLDSLRHSSTVHRSSVGGSDSSSSGDNFHLPTRPAPTTHLQTLSSNNSTHPQNRTANHYHHQTRQPSAFVDGSLSDDEWNINSTSSFEQPFGRSSWTYTKDTSDHHPSYALSNSGKGKLNPPTIDSPSTRRSDPRKRNTSKTLQQPGSSDVTNDTKFVVVGKVSTSNVPSPDSVMVSNDDGWGSSFPSSNGIMMFDDNPFLNFDADFQAQQRNVKLAKNLFPANFNTDTTTIENTPDPDFFFLDEEEESYFSEKSSSKQNPSSHPTTNTSSLPAAVSTTTSDNQVVVATASSSIPTQQEPSTVEGMSKIAYQDPARSQRIGITPYSPRWAADTNSSYTTKLSSITPAGLLVINHEQNTNDGDISSIGIQSVGSPGRKNERTVIAAAAMASGSVMGSKNPVDTPKDEGSVTVHGDIDRMRQNTAKSDRSVHFAKPNKISNKSFLPTSSSFSDDEILDNNSSSSSAEDGNAFLFDTVENILGPRTMSADMESLGGFSNLSGNSKKSGRRYSSRTGATSSINPLEHTSGLKRNGSFHSTKSALNNQRSSDNVHNRSDNLSVSSRRSVVSKSSFREGHDVTATLLQLEGKLLMGPIQGSEYTVARTSSATSASKHKARKIVVLAPPGRLGIILANRTNTHTTVVSEVRETSPLAGKIGVGDKIIAVDDENVSGKTVAEITKLMAKKVDAHRTLTFLTTREAE